jgi:putative transport protein
MIGAIVLIVCALIDSSLLKDLLLGILAGSMTSTPAMSAALETYGSASSVAIGYGISYWIGLLSVVLFVQLFRLPYAACRNDRQQNHEKSIPHTADIVKRLNQTDSLMLLSGTVLIGSILSLILPIGNTGGVLVSGLLIGFLVRKRGKLLCDLAAYKSLGLILFFIGNGITAGVKLNTGLSWCYFFYGAMISVLAIGLGYSLIHFVLRFSKSDTLAILCGGMTSTPAIGVLQDRDQDTDLSLYATSYVGALITLLVFVQIIVRVWM